jgi:16S rRNA processing protein RimM
MVRVARLGRPHGLDGFLGLYVDPDDLIYFAPGSVVHIDDNPYEVRAIRPAGRGFHVSFVGVDDRNSAELIRNMDVLVSQRRRLEEGEYWPEDLIGLQVRPSGGMVIGVENGPAQDRLIIDRAGQVFEVPFVEALVPVVDLDAGYLEIIPIEGLVPHTETET